MAATKRNPPLRGFFFGPILTCQFKLDPRIRYFVLTHAVKLRFKLVELWFITRVEQMVCCMGLSLTFWCCLEAQPYCIIAVWLRKRLIPPTTTTGKFSKQGFDKSRFRTSSEIPHWPVRCVSGSAKRAGFWRWRLIWKKTPIECASKAILECHFFGNHEYTVLGWLNCNWQNLQDRACNMISESGLHIWA